MEFWWCETVTKQSDFCIGIKEISTGLPISFSTVCPDATQRHELAGLRGVCTAWVGEASELSENSQGTDNDGRSPGSQRLTGPTGPTGKWNCLFTWKTSKGRGSVRKTWCSSLSLIEIRSLFRSEDLWLGFRSVLEANCFPSFATQKCDSFTTWEIVSCSQTVMLFSFFSCQGFFFSFFLLFVYLMSHLLDISNKISLSKYLLSAYCMLVYSGATCKVL